MRLRGAKVTSSEMGMLTPMMSVLLTLFRKRNNTSTAKRPPTMAVLRTSEMLLSMKIERSPMTRNCRPSES